MLGHRAQYLVVRGGVAEGEGLELGLAATDDVDRADAEQLHDLAQFGDGQRIAQILADRQLDAGLADERQRSATLTAARVVEEEVSHGVKDIRGPRDLAEPGAGTHAEARRARRKAFLIISSASPRLRVS
jgi:hypothetical protein